MFSVNTLKQTNNSCQTHQQRFPFPRPRMLITNGVPITKHPGASGCFKHPSFARLVLRKPDLLEPSASLNPSKLQKHTFSYATHLQNHFFKQIQQRPHLTKATDINYEGGAGCSKHPSFFCVSLLSAFKKPDLRSFSLLNPLQT